MHALKYKKCIPAEALEISVAHALCLNVHTKGQVRIIVVVNVKGQISIMTFALVAWLPTAVLRPSLQRVT